MTATPQEIYERYIWAGAITRNADALAEMFTTDGVWEAPLIPAGGSFPRRPEGREQIRTQMAAYYEQLAAAGDTVDAGRSRYVIHTTGDPQVFIAEIDTVLNGPDGARTVSLVQIFRTREGKITLVRDYFAAELMAQPSAPRQALSRCLPRAAALRARAGRRWPGRGAASGPCRGYAGCWRDGHAAGRSPVCR